MNDLIKRLQDADELKVLVRNVEDVQRWAVQLKLNHRQTFMFRGALGGARSGPAPPRRVAFSGRPDRGGCA